MCKISKDDLQVKIYTPIQQLKDAFYQAKSEQEWNDLKEQLVEILAYAEDVMDAEFYAKYKEGVVNSIKKMYEFKVKYWKKNSEKKAYTPKKTYLLQDDLAAALTKYIELQTKLLEYQYKNIFEKS